MKLSNAEKKAIVKFTDMFVTCSLNPATIHEDKDIGHKIVNIIKEVNCHRCTNPCKKFGDKCKYGFPRFPLKETLVIDKNEFSNECEDEDFDAGADTNFSKILSDIENILKDEEKTIGNDE